MAHPFLFDVETVRANTAYTFSVPQHSSSVATASATIQDPPESSSIDPATLLRWQNLFNLSPKQALSSILSYRNQFRGSQVSDQLWESVRLEKEAQGYDREAFEFESISHQQDIQPSPLSPTEKTPRCFERTEVRSCSSLKESHEDANEKQEANTTTYLLKLEAPLLSAEVVRVVAELKDTPEIVYANDDSELKCGGIEAAKFCRIDHLAREKVKAWMAKEHPGAQFTTVL